MLIYSNGTLPAKLRSETMTGKQQSSITKNREIEPDFRNIKERITLARNRSTQALLEEIADKQDDREKIRSAPQPVIEDTLAVEQLASSADQPKQKPSATGSRENRALQKAKNATSKSVPRAGQWWLVEFWPVIPVLLILISLVCFYYNKHSKPQTSEKPFLSSPKENSLLPQGYDLIEKIGEGSFGEVFKAHEKTLNRPVAIKRHPGPVRFIDR